MAEVVKDIPGYEGRYAISVSGAVYSLRSNKVLKQFIDGRGYARVALGGNSPKWSVARLVALTFIPNPNGKPEVNHKDGDKRNDRVSNLEWVTQKENIDHAKRTGLLRGRPRRDPAGATSRLHAIRLTDDEKIDYEWAAKRAKMTVSAWMRDRLNKAVAAENKQASDAKKARSRT